MTIVYINDYFMKTANIGTPGAGANKWAQMEEPKQL